MRYFDLYHGVEVQPVREGDRSVLSFAMEAHGYGAILASYGGEPSAQIQQLMAKMKELTATPLASYSHQWMALPQQLVEIKPTTAVSAAPEGMVRIPGGSYLSRWKESRLRDRMVWAWMCSIHGKTARADIMSMLWS